MKKLQLLLLVASLAAPAMAQEKFELGKPGNDAYRYLDQYKGLKEYIDHEKYPNFKLGIATENLNNSLVKNLISKNASETVAGNAMKMGSVVDGNGNMNFNNVKTFVNTATNAGVSVYGHTLAWHSQQPKGWLLKLMADKPDPNGEATYAVITSKDFTTNKTVGWKANESDYGYSIKFDATNGLKVTTTKSYSWEVQFVPMENIVLDKGKSYKMTMTVKGSKSGKLDGRLGDWGGGANFTINFTTEWKNVEATVKPTMDGNFILLHVPNYVGDVYIKSIKFEGDKQPTIPQTQQEKHDTLVYAMDKWIKGMMTACDGKVKAWDLVNEAISGGDSDGDGYYDLQHSEGYKNGTWDVGGDAFYWQDYMGDLDYVRQACRLARKYGPEDVKLFINDYNLEGTWDLTTKDGIRASKKLWALVNWIKKMAKSGKLVRVSEMDMGYNDANGKSVPTSKMTETQHKEMADFYEWIIKEYFSIIPAAQQWGICQWCATDSPENSGWRANTPVGIWDINYYRKHVYAGFVRGLYGGEPTAIEDVKADKRIDTQKGIYNLNGMRLSATSLDELPSGLYVIDGKKVIK